MSTLLHRKPALIEILPTPPRPQALSDQIYATLKHRVLTCELKPGQKLIEADLAAELGLSRTPLREALNRLGHEGLVTLAPFRGYTVAPLTLRDYQELCEVRRLIEPEVAALAAGRASPDDVERLLALSTLAYKRGQRQSYEDYLRANSAFHLAFAQCAGNRQLESLVIGVLDRHQRPCFLGLGGGIDAEESTAEHVAVVKAVGARNPERARRLMAKHIAGGERRIVAALRAGGYCRRRTA